MISFLITAKNEPYLNKTIEDLYARAGSDIEVLAEEDDGRGQRAMLNKLAKQAKGDILCKVDAHCAFAPDFDFFLLEDFEENSIIAPQMFPLYPESWTLNYENRMSNFGFDSNFIMQHLPERQGKVNEVMCLQGSFFMLTKENWFKWNICNEELGSWGSQGIELGLQAFLNGGVCKTSKKTYYGHLFRHTDKDFPYKRDHKQIDTTYARMKEKYSQVDITPLLEKFNYPLDWNVRNSI